MSKLHLPFLGRTCGDVSRRRWRPGVSRRLPSDGIQAPQLLFLRLYAHSVANGCNIVRPRTLTPTALPNGQVSTNKPLQATAANKVKTSLGHHHSYLGLDFPGGTFEFGVGTQERERIPKDAQTDCMHHMDSGTVPRPRPCFRILRAPHPHRSYIMRWTNQTFASSELFFRA